MLHIEIACALPRNPGDYTSAELLDRGSTETPRPVTVAKYCV